MSETEHVEGILTPVDTLGKDLNDYCQDFMINDGVEVQPFYESYIEQFLEEYYKDYIILNGTLYSIDKKNIDPSDGLANAVFNYDGTIQFQVRFHNGGVSLPEMIEEATGQCAQWQ